jgi:hypothetical protein
MADVVNLLKARSMLMILQSICEQTIEVLEAVQDDLRSQFTDDLRKMIGRTQSELAALTETLESENPAKVEAPAP